MLIGSGYAYSGGIMAQESDEHIVSNPPDEELNRAVGHLLDSNKLGEYMGSTAQDEDIGGTGHARAGCVLAGTSRKPCQSQCQKTLAFEIGKN
jgi:hypothetical protein